MNKRQHKKWIKKQARKMSPIQAMASMMWSMIDTPNIKWFSINNE